MNINMADKAQKGLIAQIKKHNPRLAAWLVKTNVKLDLQEFSYGDIILNRETGKESPKVGIIAKGVVEIQGQIPSPPKVFKRIQYPLALRYPGEVIGEVEFLYHELTKGPYRGRWIVYAGMQTFYFTPLMVTNDTSCFKEVKREMKRSKDNFKVEVAWLPSAAIRDKEVIGALTETAFKRLASLTSFWQPCPDELDALEKREMSQYLFLELVKAIQGARIAFRPFSLDEMASVTPWNSDTLKRILSAKKYAQFTFEDCVVLGIHHPVKESEPFIVLVHFLIDSLADPSREFKTPDLKNATEKIFSGALGIVKQSPIIVKDYPTTKRCVIALYSKNGRYNKKIIDSNNSGQDDIIKNLVQILKVNSAKLSSVSDLTKLGLLGSASLIVLPYSK